MGKQKEAVAALIKAVDTKPWQNFYTTACHTTNPFASNFGGYYFLRHMTPNLTMDGVTLNTATKQYDRKSYTNSTLENMYNLSVNPGILSPRDKFAVTTLLAEKSENTSFTKRTYEMERDDKNKAFIKNVCTAAAYSVPYSVYRKDGSPVTISPYSDRKRKN